MHGPSHNQDSLEEALKALTYRAALDNTEPGPIDVDVSDRSLAFSSPRFDDEIPKGCVGVTVQSRPPGGESIDMVYGEALTRELYDAVTDRVKWYTRACVTPGQRDHILFFFESTCRYNVHSQEVRLPGVIRGPDAVEGYLPPSMDPVVPEDTYLVPVHLLPDRYWERSEKCADCIVPFTEVGDVPWIPREDPESKSYECPKCGTSTTGLSGGVSGTWFLHDSSTGGIPQKNRCGPVRKEEKYAFMDWLLDVEPGATTTTPVGFPDAATVLTDGTVVEWLSPLEPVTSPEDGYLPGVRPFVTITPPEHELPFIVYQSDLRQLTNAIKQQDN